jgi:hypothetical protein
MRLRHVLATTALGSAIALGVAVAPAQAGEPSTTSVATVEPNTVQLYWTDSGERFNRRDPCNTRGEWYWDNYSNVYSWDCRWSSAKGNFQLWLQKG